MLSSILTTAISLAFALSVDSSRHAQALYSKAQLFRQNGELEKAITNLSVCIKLQPLPDYYVARGNILADMNKNDEALLDYEAAVRTAPRYFLAHYNIGHVHYGMRNYEQCIQSCSATIEIDPTYWPAYLLRSDAYYHLGEFDKAITDCNACISARNVEVFAYFNRGIAHLAKSGLKEAEHDFSRVIQLDPKNLSAYGHRALVRKQLKAYSSALRDLDTYLSMDPNDPLILQEKSLLLAAAPDGRMRNGKLALVLARRAFDLWGGKNIAALETMAAAYAETGDYRSAVKCLETALENSEYRKTHGTGTRYRLELYRSQTPLRLDAP
jgi:tetratricopeptide (TPR) repeat protein